MQNNEMTLTDLPDEHGHFGPYGGVFVAETLMEPLDELRLALACVLASGHLLYAIGDNEGATRLAGVRYWQVIIVLYILSALLAGIGGLVYIGLVKANTLSLATIVTLVAITVVGVVYAT